MKSSYQNLKDKIEEMEITIKNQKEMIYVAQNALAEIAFLKEPELIKAPEIAQKALWGYTKLK